MTDDSVMPQRDLMLRVFDAASQDIGDAFLSDWRKREDEDQLANDGFVLEDDADGGQRGKEDRAEASETTLDKGHVGMSQALM